MTKKGFTLIEILVVVLIIGILAAIALPKYQLAVAKSRVHTMFDLGKSIADAQTIYYLTNGNWALDMSKLDMTLPSNCSPLSENNNNEHTRFTCDNGFTLDNDIRQDYPVLRMNYCPGYNTGVLLCEQKASCRTMCKV